MSKMKKDDKSFKQQAVQLALSSNQPISKTAKELCVLESTLYSWVSNTKDRKISVINLFNSPLNKEYPTFFN